MPAKYSFWKPACFPIEHSRILKRDMDRLFSPTSIAVVGASPNPGKIGNVLMRNLAGFAGSIYPVHPTAKDVFGHRAYPTVSTIRHSVDLALLSIPQSGVIAALEDCASAGVGAAIVYSGGWAESGEPGSAAQAVLSRIAKSSGMRILGPNTSGFVRPATGIFATFVTDLPQHLRPGSLAIVAQSGGVNLSLCFLAQNEGIGVRLGVGLGNACDVGLADVLDWIACDDGTSVVALAIEGVADGRKLVTAIERLVDKRPVVALTAGRTDIGQFAKSHTGVLAGSYRVKRAALSQAGAVVVDDLTEMIDAVKALSANRISPNKNPGVGVVTGQAGPGLLLTDELRSSGVSIPQLSEKTRLQLSKLLPPLTFQENPVDTGRPGENFREVLEAVRESEGIDLLAVSLLYEPDAVDPAAALSGMSPCILCSLGPSEELHTLQATLATSGVALIATPERAAAAVSVLVRDARHQWRRRHGSDSNLETTSSYVPTSGMWDEASAKELLNSLGISTPENMVCQTHVAALSAFEKMGPPLAVKILHPLVSHKTESGGVHLNVRSRDDLNRALAEIDKTVGAQYLLERMATPGPELIVGARRDPSFGPIVVLGVGGVGVEVDDDIAIRLAPVGQIDAQDMLGELKSAARFRGHRGGPKVDEGALVAVIQSLAHLIGSRSDIAEIEINPLRVTGQGLVALDALVVMR